MCKSDIKNRWQIIPQCFIVCFWLCVCQNNFECKVNWNKILVRERDKNSLNLPVWIYVKWFSQAKIHSCRNSNEPTSLFLFFCFTFIQIIQMSNTHEIPSSWRNYRGVIKKFILILFSYHHLTSHLDLKLHPFAKLDSLGYFKSLYQILFCFRVNTTNIIININKTFWKENIRCDGLWMIRWLKKLWVVLFCSTVHV